MANRSNPVRRDKSSAFGTALTCVDMVMGLLLNFVRSTRQGHIGLWRVDFLFLELPFTDSCSSRRCHTVKLVSDGTSRICRSDCGVSYDDALVFLKTPVPPRQLCILRDRTHFGTRADKRLRLYI